jgi:hypothetical protein
MILHQSTQSGKHPSNVMQIPVMFPKALEILPNLRIHTVTVRNDVRAILKKTQRFRGKLS